ncbi:MAG: hypothetical protein QE271_11995 [Bacteriovoracaceae bacterium]|nr:hypothetical protein [Bacteriovoracaceae bacterium]
MIEWLPQVCRELHGEMAKLYWLLLLPVIVFLLILEMLKSGNQIPDGGKILLRTVISILLIASFKETINLVAVMGDGIANRIDGLAKMGKLMDLFSENFSRDAPALYKIRELFIFLLNFLSYFLAYLGIFISDALLHFTWSVLYVCAPLMILCYIPEQTAHVCKNLYKGLLTVITWKCLWSILGVLLLKLAVEKTTENSDNLITTAVINLCIALSILTVPFFAKSFIGDGVAGFASNIAGVAGLSVLRVSKNLVQSKVNPKSWGRSKIQNPNEKNFKFQKHKGGKWNK